MLILLSLAAAEELDVVFQDRVQGGLAVAGSAVATPYDGTELFFAGPDLELSFPPTATVRAAFLVLHAKNGGFLGGEEAWVRLNGVALSGDDEVASGTRYRAFEIDPVVYGLVGPGAYPGEEAAVVEDQLYDGAGVSGATLAVVWEDAGVRARRQVTFAAGYGNASGATFTLGGLARGAVLDEAVMSLGVAWECSTEQSGHVVVGGVELADGVGGRDDSATPAGVCRSDSNALWTVGSFGADADGVLVGVAGDDPDTEPAGGTAQNSRRSDELWRTAYAVDGELVVEYVADVPDAWMSSLAVSVDVDTDGDGIADADDDCTDVDGDGFGDVGWFPDCDPDCDDGDADAGELFGWHDADGDGYGDAGSRACEPGADVVGNDDDCDDTDAAVNPAGAEVCDPDNVDEDCDGVADDDDPSATGQVAGFVDVDGDGYGGTVAATRCDAAGTDDDCDDGDAHIHPGADDLPGDGIDQDCDGADAVADAPVDILNSDEPGACGCASGGAPAPVAALAAGLVAAGFASVAAARRRR